MYYRDKEKVEVDFVIQNARGHLIGIEVKASATIKESHLLGLKKLAQYCGEDFQMGVVLYDGSETMPLGNDIWAVPLSSLWGKSINE
jgi:predicted AAA+ superfamily ATPase